MSECRTPLPGTEDPNGTDPRECRPEQYHSATRWVYIELRYVTKSLPTSLYSPIYSASFSSFSPSFFEPQGRGFVSRLCRLARSCRCDPILSIMVWSLLTPNLSM